MSHEFITGNPNNLGHDKLNSLSRSCTNHHKLASLAVGEVHCKQSQLNNSKS